MKANHSSTKQGCILMGIGLTTFACLFPPLKFLGFRTWGFIFGNAGFGMVNLQFLDAGMLILELIVLWVLMGVIYYFEEAGTRRLSNSSRIQASYKFCPECGSKIASGDRFCSECGARCA